MNYRVALLGIALIIICASSGAAIAQTPPATATTKAAPKAEVPVAKEEPEVKRPKSGTLSRSGDAGYSGTAVDTWDDTDVKVGSGAPISGSCSRLGAREWSMRVFNTSDETYSVDLEVIQFSANGAKLKSDYFSYTLKAGDREEHKFTAQTNTSQCELNLRNWRKSS